MTVSFPSRCSLLAGVAATPMTALPMLTGSPAQASVETPIQRLFGEWSALYSSFHATAAHHRWSEDEWDAHLAALSEIENRMEAAPVTNLQDLALQHAAITSFGAICLDGFDGKVATFVRSGRAHQ